MTKNEIISKVRQRIDEVGVSEVISLGFPIESFVNESTNQALLDSPTLFHDNVVDFSSSTITSNSDGSGSVDLPSGYVRLVEFKMKGWSHSIYKPSENRDATLALQANPATRANPRRPLVVVASGKLLFFTIDVESLPEIDVAKAQIYKTDFISYPEELSDAISWLAASKVLQVMNENMLSESAFNQYSKALNYLR